MNISFDSTPLFWTEDPDYNGQASTPRTRGRPKKKTEFVGWGSRELIEFLKSIGKDTSKALSQFDVSDIVNQYINQNKLIHPEKKKRVMCDERLQILFGGRKKSVFRNRIHDLLESHLVENHVASDDDLYSSDEKEEDASGALKRQKVVSSDKKTSPRKKTAEVSKSCLAAISPDNIKLIYLKRTVVQKLLSNRETFESKVVGSFVRIKSDPHDMFQKNSHQLQLVTGVEAVAPAVDNKPPRLLLSGMTEDVSISALSDGDFSEEECEDLRGRVKDGLLKQPTVGEVEQKAMVLHEDITKDWLARELVLLKNLIDRAREKGWRPRVMECMDRRKLLQTPEEQSRLLSEIPKVKPEEVKKDTIPDDPLDCLDESPVGSPKVADWDWEPCYNSSVITKVSNKQDSQGPLESVTRTNGGPPEGAQLETERNRALSNGLAESMETKERYTPRAEAMGVQSNGHTESLSAGHSVIPGIEVICAESNGHLQQTSPKARIVCAKVTEPKQVEVITLSDDEEEEEAQVVRILDPGPHSEQLVWHYLDPQGSVQGPFSLSSLKRWSDADYFPSDFRIWKSGQNPKLAVPLSQILLQFFPS